MSADIYVKTVVRDEPFSGLTLLVRLVTCPTAAKSILAKYKPSSSP